MNIPNTTGVSVAGLLSAGGIWAQTENKATGDLSLNEMVDFLEPQPERSCVPIPAPSGQPDFNICADDQSQGKVKKLPARGPAICQSSDDYTSIENQLERACRDLGGSCMVQTKLLIKYMKAHIDRANTLRGLN